MTRLLKNDVSSAHEGSWVTRSALVDLVLEYGLRQWQKNSDCSPVLAAADPAIATVLDEIHDHPEHQWTVHHLARAAGLSRTQFNRRFTAAVGQPSMSYVIQLRLTHGAVYCGRTAVPLW